MTNCKDCITEGLTNNRPAPHPGKRCASHHRAVTKARKSAGRERAWLTKYGITATEYDAIKALQGGACGICGRARGVTRALSVDHDHAREVTHGSRASVRGLLCAKCNSYLGWIRDDPEVMFRGMMYLQTPPARKVLGDGHR